MRTLQTRSALRAALRQARSDNRSVGFVPTMGFLHEGHVSLMRRARRDNDLVVASIFVNPTQFGPGEDLDTYPRDPDGDAAACADAGVDLLWMPTPDEVYHPDHRTQVTVAGITSTLCGASRPHHFGGVATVVTKLLHLMQPDRLYMGQKDYQQLVVIQTLVRDLDIPTEVIGLPTVRESDGLAMSSRNARLSVEARQMATAIPQALAALRRHASSGMESREPASSLQATLRDALERAPGLTIDYAAVVDAETLDTPIAPGRPLLAAVALHCGGVRLIDNTRLDQPDEALDQLA